MEGHRIITFDIFDIIRIIADTQLTVFPVQELSPTVTCTAKHVVETLVILHEVREDMLLPLIQNMFHLIVITPQIISIIGKLIFWKLIFQNIIGEFPQPQQLLTSADIIKARELVKEVYIDERIENYIVDIVSATRNPENYGLEKFKELISYGGSPRAGISLAKASKAYAFIKRRGYVIPEDVRSVCHSVLRHRIGLTYEAEAQNVTTEEIISEILNTIPVP